MVDNMHSKLTDNYIVPFIEWLNDRLFTIAFEALYDNLKISNEKWWNLCDFFFLASKVFHLDNIDIV